jgi:pimeloyl-ACP methyl ester carboxylesterase
MVHGWPWNRLGSAAERPLSDLPGSVPVQLLPLALGLHRLGYQLLMFDQRNHGQSAAAGTVTFGLREAADLLGALDYLATRPDAGRDPIGVVGFSSGANAILYALPRTAQIGAAVAIQPTSPTVFARRYARTLLGPLGRPVLFIAELLIQLLGGVRLAAIEPAFAATGSNGTPVFYVQGTGDRWGSAADVALMVERTPTAEALYVETRGRYGGYQYAIDHPELLDAFFKRHIG